jgi:hypothetical protein
LWYACGNKVNTDNIAVEITLQRFDRDLREAALDTPRIAALRAHYGMFLEYYSIGILHIGNTQTGGYARLLHDFACAPIVETAYKKVNETFPDEKKLNAELTSGFKHLAYYFPKMPIPRVYGYVSGFNEAVMLTDSVVGVGLDRFLGDTCTIYNQLDFAKYLQRNMHPQRIPAVCLQAWLGSEYPAEGGVSGNFLQQMTTEGKILYVAKKCFPKMADTLLFGFTAKQLAWCVQHEADMWEYLLESNLLYINNQFAIQKFTGEAPFTAAFSAESPGRAVNWLAFRIVNAYMKKNNATFSELMTREAKVILKESRYNP